MHPYREFVNPHLGKLLEKLNMDKRYVRGEGCYLYDDQGQRYLDFMAAYGALPFGFNCSEIWDVLHGVEQTGEPSFVQPSYLEAAGELARRLIEVAPEGLRYVTFANSGAEAVEAAIKVCRSATGRMGILSASNSFHGKTLGALSATNRTSYQAPFGAPVPGFYKVPYGDAAALEAFFAEKGNELAAFIVEPIQGEGGIVVPPPGYLARARELCSQYGVALVVDEVQTGLGRTGNLFACEAEGIVPDVMVLAKALGGGLLPIGAMLCTEDIYNEDFATKHSSTFAGNTLACRVGIRVMEMLTRNDQALIRQVAENGAFLKAGLEALQRQYPHVLKEVRGRGYMLGLQFSVDMNTFGRVSLLGVLGEQESLTPVIASYLLNVEHIRVAPTLNGSDVIRIEPPLIATRDQCQQVIDAVGRMLRHLAEGDAAELLGHLLGVESRPQVLPAVHPRVLPEPSGDPAEGRWAFLVHPLDPQNYRELDTSLQVFSDEEIWRLADRFNEMLDPFVVGATRIVADDGRTAYGEFIVIPRTPEQLLAMPRHEAVDLMQKGIDLARKRGARIVGLGAYTSVVTRAGLALKNPGVALTTGNSYTVVSAVDAIYEAIAKLGTNLAEATVAVVGATGSIGRATAILLSEKVHRLILVGNPAHPDAARKRLLKVAADVCRFLAQTYHENGPFPAGTIGAALQALGPVPDPEAEPERFEALATELEARGYLVISTEIDQVLPEADLVVTATSSLEHLVRPDNLKFGAAVLDFARPPNVSRAVQKARPDVLVIDGGVVAVPGLPDFHWKFGFEQGLAYACMAETMILGLEHHYEDTSLGSDLNLPTILALREAGKRLGFSLAQLRSFNRPLTQEAWDRLMACRSRVPHPVGDD